jgi:iron complex outermembrane receptor protein
MPLTTRVPLFGLAFACALLGFAQAAFGQAAENDDDGSGGQLEEIIVSARFREESLQDTPVAITAVVGEELQAMGFTNMTEIGRAVPNAFFRQGGSPWGRSNQVFIRGVGQADFQFSQEPRTATYVDDVYYASVFGSVFDLLDLQQVEVLRGPQGTLFGRNAMGGAIRMVSKRPEGGGTGNLELTLGHFDRVDVRGSFDQTLIEDKLFLRVSGASKQRDGYQRQLDFTCQMIKQGTPQYAGIGDGIVGWNPDPDAIGNRGGGPLQGSPIFGAVGSAADNAFSFPRGRPGAPAGDDCIMGYLGGEDVQAARAMLRWVAGERFEATIAAHYSDDASSVQASWLMGLGNAAGVQNTVPGTLTGLPANMVNYNNGVIGRAWGIAYDSRFVPPDPFSTYATYADILRAEQYPAVSTARNQGWSAVFDWDLSDNLDLRVIVADHKVSGEYSDDADESPVTLSNVWGPVASDEQSFEARLSGRALNDRFEWTVGAFLWDAEQSNTGRVSLIATDWVLPPFFPFFAWDNDDFNEAENTGYYFHSIATLTDKLSLTAGYRTSEDEKVFRFSHFFDATVPGGGESDDWKVGFDYKLNERMMAYVQVATGYTASTFNGRPFTPQQLIAQPPEDLKAYEAGFKTDFDAVRFNATVFHSDYASRVAGIAQTLDANGIPSTVAVTGPAVIDGLELEVNAAIGEFWNANFSVGYLDYTSDAIAAGLPTPTTPCGREFCAPANETGAPPGQPRKNMSGGLSYVVMLPGGGAITPRLDLFWTDEVASIQPGGVIDAYTLTNFRVTYETPNRDWSLSYALTNASDEFYLLNIFDLRAFDLGTVKSQPGRPREWSLTFRHNFGG